MKKFFLLFFAIFKLGMAYININPVTFDKGIDGKGDGEIYTLFNGSEKPVRYSIYLESPPKGRDMSSWLEFYPKTITLRPGQSGEVKVFAKAPADSETGEYTAILGLREQSVPDEESMKKGISAVQVLTNLRIQIAGYVGDVKPNLKLHSPALKREGNSLIFSGEMENIGGRRGTFQGYLEDSSGKNSFYLGEKRVLKGEKISLDAFSQEIKNRDIEKKVSGYRFFVLKDKSNGKEAIKIKL